METREAVTSTTGEAPLTTTVSSRLAGLSVALMVAVNPTSSLIPSRLKLPNPDQLEQQAVVAARRQVRQPVGSVRPSHVASRMPIKAGPVTVTVTPGNTPPLWS